MGIWYNAYTIFGIEYSYEELKHLKDNNDFKKCSQQIGCNDLPNLLSQIYNDNILIFMTNDYYQDENNQNYYFGIQLTEQLLYSHPDYVKYNEKIEEECKKLKIIYKIPQIFNIVVKS